MICYQTQEKIINEQYLIFIKVKSANIKNSKQLLLQHTRRGRSFYLD